MKKLFWLRDILILAVDTCFTNYSNKLRFTFSWVILVCLNLLTSVFTPSFAWNRPTHMVTGAIAYRELQTTAPQTLAKTVAILKQHPEYQQLWATKLNDSTLTEDDRNQYLFMMAARWADDVRGKAYDHPTWHYINYTYAPDKSITRVDTAKNENILQAFAQNQQILRSNAPDSAKAIALCWLFHLTGDVHMPLHAVDLVSPKFPTGDKGGNLFKIKVLLSSNTINLHSFWDGMLLGSDGFQAARNLAVELRQLVPRNALSQLGTIDVVTWSKESFQLAQDKAYQQNTLVSGTDQEGAVLPTDYVASVKPIAQRQVALAGYRLADELKRDL